MVKSNMDNDQEKQSTPETETNVPQPNEPAPADSMGVETQDSVPDPTPVEDPTPPADQTPEPAMAAAAQISPEPKKSPKKLILGVIIALVVIVLGVVAWTLMKGDKSDGTNNNVTATTQIKPIAQLTVGGQDGPIGNDHVFPNAPPAEMAIIVDFQVFEGLVGYDNQKLTPLLATSWTNPDNKTWVFELKQGVKFQNGKTMTAEDVKTSLEGDIKNEGFGHYLSTVKSVSVTGPNQITITTVTPDALLLNRLVYGFIYTKDDAGNYIGTGAYTVVKDESKTEDVTKLVAFDGYHQGTPKTRAIQFKVYEDQDKLNQDILNGKVNSMTDVANDTYAQQAAAKNITFTTYEPSGVFGLELNMLKSGSPLQKKEVREALAYATDRAAYVKDMNKQEGSTRTTANYLIPKSVIGYSSSATFPETDLAKAKDLLAKAGYPDGVKLTFAYIKGIQPGITTLASQMNKGGFDVTAKGYDTPDKMIAALSKGDFDLIAVSYNSDLGDGVDTMSSLLSSNGQFPSYSSKDFDNMITNAEQTFNAAEHLQKVQAINQYVADNYLWIPISNRTFAVYYPKKYNYQLDSITGASFMHYWKLGEITSSTKN